MLFQIFQLIFWISFFLIFGIYISYFVVLRYYNSKNKSEFNRTNGFYPPVSFVIPVYNEETIVSKKIKNIEDLKYPAEKIEAVFVDGCSTDKTPSLIENYSNNGKIKITLVRECERSGYNSAICQGIQKSSANIIVMTDGGSYYDNEALKHLVQPLEDSLIGAVTGKEVVLGADEALGPKLEAKYREFYDFMRAAETRMDSTPDSKGEILAVRKSVCMNLIQKINLSSSASFDCCIPYQAKIDGYRTVFEPKSMYFEYAPSSFMDRMKQQIRRAVILMGSLILFKNVILNKKYGKFGLIITPFHFIMQVVAPWLFVSALLSLSIMTILNFSVSWFIWLALIIPVAVVGLKNRTLLLSFIQSQIALLVATVKVVTKRSTQLIDTIPSTRK